MCWTLEDDIMTIGLFKGLYEESMCSVEHIASVAWKRRLNEHSCLSPSHHIYQEKSMKCKLNMIHHGRYQLIEACNGYMKTELSKALP